MTRESRLDQTRGGYILQEVNTKQYGYRLHLTLEQVLSIVAELGRLPIDADDMTWNQSDFNKFYGLPESFKFENVSA